MSEEQCKYYRFGYSGCNFLCINRSVYTQSELLSDGVIREVQCDKDDKWMKVRERREESEEWIEIGLDGLKHHDVIDLNIMFYIVYLLHYKIIHSSLFNNNRFNKRTALRLLSGSPTLVLTQLVVT